MLSISEAAKLTGIPSYTLRYYERLGLLPPSKRSSSGRRFYTEDDLKFMKFIKSLKETGMALEDIHEFVKDGCILEKINSDVQSTPITPSLNKRIEILTRHLEGMEMKKKELEGVIDATKVKLDTYYSMLKDGVEEK
ncbi:MerR family transcriptional regulator [Falsibacillus albus]|uniref:MerR family transcriptional regulator n=2 Tax=Falsibacillus albus TaxID=2478915 RepID=A0A3L7JV48_9BACI|nr:MerR family transcriptional regulator [Falsibacillus albus]